MAEKEVRWSEEELRLMAREEAAATEAGVTFLNQHLMGKVPGRSLEATKGVRRRADYRRMVQAAVIDLRAAPAPPFAMVAESPVSHGARDVQKRGSPGLDRLRRASLGVDVRAAVANLVTQIDEAGERSCRAEELVQIAGEALNGSEVGERLLGWYRAAFPGENSYSRRAGDNPVWRPGDADGRRPADGASRRSLRRREYARVQSMWRTIIRGAVRLVLDGDEGEPRHSFDEMVAHWSDVFRQESRVPTGPVHAPGKRPELARIWDAVSCEEVETCGLEASSAPGLDGVTVRRWRACPSMVRALFFNLVMMRGGFPKEMTHSRTIFIPKVAKPESPREYR